MPDEVARFLEGPTPYAGWWWWLGLGCLALVLLWFGAVVVATLPSAALRAVPVLRDIDDRLARRRYAAAVRAVAARRHRGELTDAQACAQLSRTVRGFLHRMTGAPVHYLHVSELGEGGLAPAAPVLAVLRDGRFGDGPAPVHELAARAEELIRSWA